MAAIVARSAVKAAPNIVLAPVLCVLCAASALTAITFSVKCGADVKATNNPNKLRDCGLTGLLWCLFVVAVLMWISNAYSGLQKAFS